MRQVLSDPIRVGGARFAVISDVLVHAERGKSSVRFICQKHPRYVLIDRQDGITAFTPAGRSVGLPEIEKSCSELLQGFRTGSAR